MNKKRVLRALMIDDSKPKSYAHDACSLDSKDLDITIARNYEIGIQMLQQEKWDILFLDHDLASYDADGCELTGISVLHWLADHPAHLPECIESITCNICAAPGMIGAIEALYATYPVKKK